MRIAHNYVVNMANTNLSDLGLKIQILLKVD